MNPLAFWSPKTPPTPAKDKRRAAPVSGWEAAMSESIHVGAKLEGEAAALAAIRDHRSIVYLAADEGEDVAYKAAGLSATADIPTRGFGGLAALARAGHAGGEEVVCCPLRTELVKKDDAEVVDGILLRLSRPTLIMCTSGRRASAAKAIYLGRKGGLTHLTDELIEAASADEYRPLIPEEAMSPMEQHHHRQTQGGQPPWHEHPKLRRWVEVALDARAGPGTEEEALAAGVGIEGMGGEGI